MSNAAVLLGQMVGKSVTGVGLNWEPAPPRRQTYSHSSGTKRKVDNKTLKAAFIFMLSLTTGLPLHASKRESTQVTKATTPKSAPNSTSIRARYFKSDPGWQ